MAYLLQAIPTTLSHLQSHSLLEAFRRDFYLRNAKLERICCHRVSACPSVSLCLLKAGVIPKQLRVGSRRQRYTIAHGL